MIKSWKIFLVKELLKKGSPQGGICFGKREHVEIVHNLVLKEFSKNLRKRTWIKNTQA